MRQFCAPSAVILVLILGGFPSVGNGYPLLVSDTQWDFADDSVGIPFTIDLPVADPPEAAATGTLTIEAFGDIDRDDAEYITFSVESIGLGILFNGDIWDDRFDNASFGDHGGVQYQTVRTTSATLTAEELVSLTADGVVSVIVERRDNVNDMYDDPDEYITATIEYEAVPEPAALSMIVLGGLAVLRRRRS